ncbi:hypothetical protein [Peptoniphilus raoultii]|uniref:hypothetical protein n=1 Tax=Peptoniphilus raoultii TaxID=1776387 RepID=UPI0008DA1E9E|nr:hypothetical protein [Peptoniphilus raoultii]
MVKKLFKILKILIFTGLVVFGIFQLNNIFIRKSLAKPWDMGNKIGGYFNEDDHYNLMFFGTSHSYCSFNPLLIYSNTGLKSYVLASQQQPLKANYYYMKEALNRDNPEIFFVDIESLISFINEDDSVIHSYTDYLPMSLNKIKMIFDIVPQKARGHALIPLIKYHDRWAELKDEDFGFDPASYHDYLRGYVFLKGSSSKFKNEKIKTDKNILKPKKPKALGDSYKSENLKYLDKIVKLAGNNNVRLYFLKTPIYNEEPYKEALRFWKNELKKRNLYFIDFNEFKNDMNLTKEDFYDSSHLNYLGAEKFNKFFINFLFQNDIYRDVENLDPNWMEDLRMYNLNR